jgi:Mn-dependent DtxR family transcriptional regulator
LNLLNAHAEMTVNDLRLKLNVSRQFVHHLLKELDDEELSEVFGKPSVKAKLLCFTLI